MAAKTICPVCKNPKMKCSCKKQRSVSVSTIGIRRSENAGNIDLTPKVKINLKALSKELEKFTEDDKESGFILDCTNKNKSTKKEYVSL